MPLASITFDEVILALHIISVVVAFGVLFTYPLFLLVGARLDPSSMPWFHQLQASVSRRVVSPGLLGVVVFGVILASEFHAWKAFYVQWGIGAAIVIGALEGMLLAPRAGRLAELARRDTGGHAGAGAGGAGGAGQLSGEYRALARQSLLITGLEGVIVLVTIFLMALHTGG